MRDDTWDDKTLRSAATFFERWRGSHVRVYELTVSLRNLSIVVFEDGDTMMTRNLCLHVNPSPLWMSGPFEWTDADLRLELVDGAGTPIADAARGNVYRLSDLSAGFELFTEQVGLREHVKLR